MKAGWRGISKDHGKHGPKRETKEEYESLNYCYDTPGTKSTVESLTRGGHVEELNKTRRERMSQYAPGVSMGNWKNGEGEKEGYKGACTSVTLFSQK